MKSKPVSKIIQLVSILIMVTACGGSANGDIQGKAETSFQQFATSASTPYQNVRYDVLNNDGTFATVQITAQFKMSATSDWTEHQTSIQCRKVGSDWQCDSILAMDFSQAEQQKQGAAQQAAITKSTQAQQNIQNSIKIEIVDTPHLGQGLGFSPQKSQVLLVPVKVTNDDSQPHVLCIGAQALLNVPDSVLGQGGWSNPIEWTGSAWDWQQNKCVYSIGANTSNTVTIGLSNLDGQNPSPTIAGDSLQLIQLCADIHEVDGNAISISWKKDQSTKCSRYGVS